MPRKQLVQFDVEHKIIRRAAAPAFHKARIRDRVKARVHLDRLEMLRVPRQPFPGWHFFWIPMLDESRVRPARGADEDLGFCFQFHALANSIPFWAGATDIL